MKCTIPEISWHNREPVLSADIHSISNEFYKLATSGGDSHILIWQMTIDDNGTVKQELISDLTRHQKAVNIVRWSPSGKYLASADDDGNIIIWHLKTDNIPLLEGDTGDKEIWNVYKVLRGHKEDIYDMCWSPSSLKLFSGSIDNTAILWDIPKGKMDHIITDHKGFVQGVAWDPKNQLLASICTDRICRLFDTTGKQVKARILKGKLPLVSEHFLYEKEVKYFHDDTFKSFYRRLQFSPDGSLLFVPSGHMEGEDCKRILNATLVFTLDNTNEPAALLPHGKQCSTVVRCCPILFELREEGPEPLVKLPYRMIFAIGTDHDVILYDTQQRVPFARLQDIHYTRMTDLTWSSDGLFLVASSTDGFCALITFEPGELGVQYVKEETEEEENTVLGSTALGELSFEKDENADLNKSIDNEVKVKDVEKKKPSFIEKWASSPQPKPKRLKPIPVSTEIGNEKNSLKTSSSKVENTVSDCTEVQEIIIIDDKNTDLNKRTAVEIKEPVEKRPSLMSPQIKPKRLKPIPVGDKSQKRKKTVNDSSTIKPETVESTNEKNCDGAILNSVLVSHLEINFKTVKDKLFRN